MGHGNFGMEVTSTSSKDRVSNDSKCCKCNCMECGHSGRLDDATCECPPERLRSAHHCPRDDAMSRCVEWKQDLEDAKLAALTSLLRFDHQP